MISIIVPIYNAELYLHECIDSLLHQTISDIEVIAIDDGSSDNSYQICAQYAQKDSRFRSFTQENAGVSAARNRALQEAKGEYVCFVDADDIVAPNFISHLLKLSQSGDFAVCDYTRDITRLEEDDTNHIARRYPIRQFITNIFNESIKHPNIWMMLFKKSIIQMHHLNFTVGCVRNEDTEFYIKYMIHERNVSISNYKGYFYRDNPNSAMHVTKRNAFTSFEASEKVGRYLAENGIQMSYNKMLYGSIQAYSVSLSRERNLELYEELHKLYNVPDVMRTLLRHPRFLRRIVSFMYIVLRKKVFYSLFSLIGK